MYPTSLYDNVNDNDYFVTRHYAFNKQNERVPAAHLIRNNASRRANFLCNMVSRIHSFITKVGIIKLSAAIIRAVSLAMMT